MKAASGRKHEASGQTNERVSRRSEGPSLPGGGGEQAARRAGANAMRQGA